MKKYNLEEFAEKIGTDIESLKKLNQSGILVPYQMPVYTDEHCKLYNELIESNKIGEEISMTTTILIKEENEEFIISIKHLFKNEYIELNRLKTYKNARIFAMKKKSELEKIGINIDILKEI